MNKQEFKKILLRLDKLEKFVFNKEGAPKKISQHSSDVINFSLNHRAFVSRYASDKSGPKKFVLIIAFLSKGEVGKEISVSRVKDLWKKMASRKLLGNYNNFYSSEPKTRGWIDSSKYGFCYLTNEWKNIFK